MRRISKSKLHVCACPKANKTQYKFLSDVCYAHVSENCIIWRLFVSKSKPRRATVRPSVCDIVARKEEHTLTQYDFFKADLLNPAGTMDFSGKKGLL